MTHMPNIHSTLILPKDLAVTSAPKYPSETLRTTLSTPAFSFPLAIPHPHSASIQPTWCSQIITMRHPDVLPTRRSPTWRLQAPPERRIAYLDASERGGTAVDRAVAEVLRVGVMRRCSWWEGGGCGERRVEGEESEDGGVDEAEEHVCL